MAQMLNPYMMMLECCGRSQEIMTITPKIIVGAKHYRNHSRISPQSSNGNASPKLRSLQAIADQDEG